MTPQVRAAFVGLLLITSLAVESGAVDLRDVLTDYTLTSWSRKDGLVGPIWAIDQDAEGFLWVGTEGGLVRFDGVRFLPWNDVGAPALPQLPVRSLRVSRGGTLWIGFGGTGGVGRIDGKTARVYGPEESAGIGSIAALVEDQSGTVWAAGSAGLYRFVDGRWERLTSAHGLPDASVLNAYVDLSGGLWVSTSVGLFSRTTDQEVRFRLVEPSDNPLRGLSLSLDGGGRLWSSDPLIGFRRVGDAGAGPPGGTQAGRGYRLLHDRQGHMWIGTIGQGLWRARPSGEPNRLLIEKTTVLSGLSSDAVRSVFEDADGNIWAGTTDGIDRLVPHRVTPWTGLGLVGTIDVTPDDRVWVGTAEGVLRFTRTWAGWEPEDFRVNLRGVRALRADPVGRVWALAGDGLFRLSDAGSLHAVLPAGSPTISTIAADPRGGIWAVGLDGSIIRDDGRRTDVVDGIGELNNVRITAAFADRTGRLWVAFDGSRIGAMVDRGHFRSYSAQDGLGGGPHYGFFEDADGALWIAGADGLTRFAGDRFSTVTRANGLPPGGVFAVTQDEERNLWLGTASGILRLKLAEFDAALANPQGGMHYRLYDTADGLAGLPAALGDRSGVRSDDGSLWFVTSRGLSVVQPGALSAERIAPAVTIDSVTADDRLVSVDGFAALNPGTTKLQIDYTAPDITYALKTRFRYRLDGFDADWVDAGSRRQALYTNLPPRHYAFRVQVSGDENRWAPGEANWAFVIPPRFYQTWWFYTLAALTVSGAIWGAWQLRLRQLRRQFALVLGERVRVSRELHDTLLQSLVGVALEFDVIARSLESSPASARDRVVKMRERVEEYIREARRSIWSLRSPALETRDLVEALRESGERAAAGQPVAFEFSVSGTPRRYSANLEHQLLRIGQEAVVNAVRHSKAHTVTMNLQFDQDEVALRVEDDGAGFSPGSSDDGTTDHYGMTTMRERAQQVGGRISIRSEPNAGTVIEAVVPASAGTEEMTA
jgi:signal transduction histidine kinase/ligand-binding sensor domain-containing protein